MANLKTNYLGVELKNPIVIGASNLASDLNTLKKIENAGAAAVVYKSLFEEQIQLESLELQNQLDEYAERHAEMVNLFPDIDHAGPEEYLMNLENAVKSVDIPVFASLNAVYKESWVDFAKKIEGTGVAGMELNFYAVPKDFEMCGKDIIDEQLEIVKEVRAAVNIPLGVKLSPYYTNILSVIKRMDSFGINGFVLFNRLFQPEIDIDEEVNYFPYNLSHESDNKLPLRFAGLLYGNVAGTVCSNSGIMTGHDVVKMILAGADCTQVVSTLYKNKIDYIGTMLKDIEEWMDEKKYATLNDFKGKLSKKNIKDPYAYKRAQYVEILMKSDNIFAKYPSI
ncbi:MAG: dihydroorotate dehydrogenase-like protein [Bacteroidales bacterium]|nr:dihydroorotate dehydrogenase-like protein [Bacteroidales bacterium]MCF8454988.1 dihydroorotate dehydrogenase-like protein [Bacteroidales bacterium]